MLRSIVASDQPMQRSPFHPEPLDPFFHCRILDQRRSMMRLGTRIYDHRTTASPVFEFSKTSNSINVMRRIASGKSYPEKIIQACRNKRSIIRKYDKRE